MAADGGGGTGVSGSTPRPTVDPGWLAARAAADTSARAATLGSLLPELISYLTGTGRDGVLKIIDLGAGTGANQRWLAPRLPFPQRWIHLDHDPVISRSLPLPDHTMIIDAGVETLGRLLASRSTDQHLVTCSALLDVLTMDQLDAVCRAVIDNQVPTLLSLTVTGTLNLTPVDPHDQLLQDAFNDHQGAPAEWSTCRHAGRRRVVRGRIHGPHPETSWQLTASSDAAFVDQLLQERLEAAVAHDPTLAAIAVPGSSYDAPSSRAGLS